ncbi:hypothetical protein EGW08_015939, partial [Elysia chlorotica]
MMCKPKYKSASRMALSLVMALMAVISEAGASPTSNGFDKAFHGFLYEHGYKGGAVAAMKDGRLLFAEGFGEDRVGQQVSAHSKFHVSSLAKSFTSVAIMRLVRENRINLTDRVFGAGGLLEAIQPWREETVDPRLRIITVDHLLRHSCGWDVDQGPLYDPLLNKLYLARGHNVPDIARQMGEAHPLDPRTLISYVISQPLDFAPGTKSAYSNMAYIVLGRVVEAASKMKYEDFVAKYILEPCGMWNTRLDLPPSDQDFAALFTDRQGDKDQSLFRDIDMRSVDSALGWFSTVYDLMRFTRCTFETGQMLNDQHLELMLARSAHGSPELDRRTETWNAAGFLTNTRGIVWQDSDAHADDLILYHDMRPPKAPAEASSPPKRRDTLPESWVILLHGKSANHIRHYSYNLMTFVDTSEASSPRENPFLLDLSDLHRHPSWNPDLAWSWRQMTIRYRVEEHEVSAYMDALKGEGFDVQWFTSNPDEQHTSFLVMGKRVKYPVRARYDFVFKHGMDHRSLLKNKLWLERSGYNITQLHSYVSRSSTTDGGNKKSKWAKEDPSFAALFRYQGFPLGTQMKYGTGHLTDPYKKLVQMYHEKNFYPVSQTVTWAKSQKSEEFAFVFIKRADARKPRTKFNQLYDLTSNELAQVTAQKTKEHLRLTYLNSYEVASGKCRFSAVFTNSTQSRGMLEMGQAQDKTSAMTILNMRMGLAPKFMVPYKENGTMKYAVYYEE